MRINGKPSLVVMVLSLVLLLTTGFSPSVLAIGDRIAGVEGGIQLTDPELDEIRGGYAGVLFGMAYWLYVDTQGNQAANFSSTASPTFTLGDNMIAQVEGNGLQITAGAGELPNGASGIFNIVRATGNDMTIISNLSVHIALVTVKNQAAIPKLNGFTPW